MARPLRSWPYSALAALLMSSGASAHAETQHGRPGASQAREGQRCGGISKGSRATASDCARSRRGRSTRAVGRTAPRSLISGARATSSLSPRTALLSFAWPFALECSPLQAYSHWRFRCVCVSERRSGSKRRQALVVTSLGAEAFVLLLRPLAGRVLFLRLVQQRRTARAQRRLCSAAHHSSSSSSSSGGSAHGRCQSGRAAA